MSQVKRGLGKGLSDLGLSELLGGMDSAPSESNESSVSTEASSDAGAKQADTKKVTLNAELRHLSVDEVQPGKYQPRQQMSESALQELADSIKSQGIIQPIVVRTLPEGKYEIIAGERRWRAAQMAGLTEVPAVVRAIKDDAAIAMSLIENIQRQDLNAIEEAQALARLIEEFDMTHDAVAKAVGKSRASVSNLLRLLQLPSVVRGMVEQGQLDMGHARALLSLSPAEQVEVAQQVIERSLSVRQTEELIKQLQQPHHAHHNNQPAAMDPDVKRLQNNLAERLGAIVNIRHTNGGKGRLVIHYNSLDELDGILGHIQ
ncbi:MAG: ParB/RepB/Spo0J family partition protein [Coxiellaceae bacterium]|nr:ParB/RepB/Spo0J family partition protein [Coxiellaceae bacterium]